MKCSVFVSSSIGSDTKYLIADEMTTMLDSVTQAKIWKELILISRERNIGLMIISHETELLAKLCGRISICTGNAMWCIKTKDNRSPQTVILVLYRQQNGNKKILFKNLREKLTAMYFHDLSAIFSPTPVLWLKILELIPFLTEIFNVFCRLPLIYTLAARS